MAKLLSVLAKGTWSSVTAYTIADIVDNDGSSYICIANNTNQEPPNATYWALLASKGGQGLQGETGAQGEQGEQGEVGPSGDMSGPGVSVDGELALFDGTSGTEIKRATGSGLVRVTDGIYSVDESPTSLARQAIINGNFDIWQRNTTFTNPASTAYTADRFRETNDANGGTWPTLTHSRQTITSGDVVNAFYCYRINANGAGTPGAQKFYNLQQLIEHGVRNLCGAGKKLTLSFWAKSSMSDKRIGLSLRQNYGSGGSPSAEETLNGETITLTSSWQKFTHTFNTNTLVGKTFGTNNNDLIALSLWLAWGSGIYTEIGAASVEGFSSGDIDIAQVQLCAGEIALPFQSKSFDEELRACQRYYQRIESVGASYDIGSGSVSSSTIMAIQIALPVYLRATPSFFSTTPSGAAIAVVEANSAFNVAELVLRNLDGLNRQYVSVNATVASGLTAGRSGYLRINSGSFIAFDAEL